MAYGNQLTPEQWDRMLKQRQYEAELQRQATTAGMRNAMMRRSNPPADTGANAPLYQARRRTSARREMMDAYFGAPTLADAMYGYNFTMKDKAYKNRLGAAYAKMMGLGAYRRRR